jgi:hypothetical protein
MRPRTCAIALLVVVGAIACTGGSSPDATPSGSTSSTSALPSGPITFVKGEYESSIGDIDSRLRWAGGDGTLDVDNGSDQQIGAPSVYAITQAGESVDAELTDAAPIDAGASVSLAVRFPRSLRLDDVGLFVLSFGDENVGAMAPVIDTG